MSSQKTNIVAFTPNPHGTVSIAAVGTTSTSVALPSTFADTYQIFVDGAQDTVAWIEFGGSGDSAVVGNSMPLPGGVVVISGSRKCSHAHARMETGETATIYFTPGNGA